MGLSAYTMVRMEDGSEKRAEDVVVGDRLYEPVSGGSARVERILSGPGVGMCSVALANGEVLHLTGDQPVLTVQGAVAAGDLRQGMQLQTVAGPVACAEAASLMGDYMVYDLNVSAEQAATYLAANGVVLSAARLR